MPQAKTVTPDGGFIARVTFDPDSAEHYSPNGHSIVEVRYTEQDDIHEFIAFMMEHEAYIIDATVLFSSGLMIDARSLPD